jgi:uncharacterized protein DUF4012
MGPAAQEEPVELAAPRRRHIGRRLLLVVGIALVIVVAVEALFLVSIRRDLTAGRDALAAARRQAIAGDLDTADSDLANASASFASASDRAHGVLGIAARVVPWLGNGADAATAMADAGGSLTNAGVVLVDALREVPGGLAGLAPAHGALPLDRYTALAAPVRRASEDAADAATTLSGAPDTAMPGSLATARWDAEDQATRLATDLHGISQLLEGAAEFGGADGPRRYLVVAQNPAELRGTGGIWGAYAIVTAVDGHVQVSSARPTQSLRDFPAGRVESPSEDYARNYDQFGGAGSWQNMNMTPDFPAAAQAALANYELGEHGRVNGVWAVDPFALRSFLAVTGPVGVPGAGEISERNVVAFTTNRAYSAFAGPAQRKEVLGAVAAGVFGEFLAMDEHALARLRALGESIADGHLRIYAEETDVQRGLSTLGVDGALAVRAGDIDGVIVNNGSGSKVDYYARRDVMYDVQLGGAGESITNATITIDNDAPTSGQPRYVIGPYVEGAKPGDQTPFTSVWCHAPCDLRQASKDGASVEFSGGSENGLQWLRDYRTIPAGGRGTLSLTWHSSGVWSGNSSGGTFQLTLLGQTTVRPTRSQVVFHAPEGQDIVWTSQPMEVDGNTATWVGAPSATTSLSIRFRAPLPMRLLRDVLRPLGGG